MVFCASDDKINSAHAIMRRKSKQQCVICLVFTKTKRTGMSEIERESSRGWRQGDFIRRTGFQKGELNKGRIVTKVLRMDEFDSMCEKHVLKYVVACSTR